jgi:hypothetical protein
MARSSRRIEFDVDDIKFMETFRETNGVPMQVFVEQAVKEKIEVTKVQIYLNEK